MSWPLPPFLRPSPAGTHVVDVDAFLSSSLAEPAGDSPQYQGYATDDAYHQFQDVFPEQPQLLKLFLFNKSRATQRVCPACRRLYKVGQGVYGSLVSLHSQLGREQDLSGICSDPCATAMGADEVLGESAESLSQEDFDKLNERGGGHPTGLQVHKASAELEQALGMDLGGADIVLTGPSVEEARARARAAGVRDDLAVVWP